MFKSEISERFDRGLALGYKYMAIFWDDFDNIHYPHYTHTAEEMRNQLKRAGGRLQEVYDLSGDKSAQLLEERAYHLPDTSTVVATEPPKLRRSARIAEKKRR